MLLCVYRGGDELNQRIKFLREKACLTQAEFGSRVGARQNTVSSWEVGRITPNDSALLNICQTFDVREEWLRTGNGPMEVQHSMDEVLSKFFDSVLADPPESPRRRILTSFASFSSEDWETMWNLMQMLKKGTK